MDKFEFFIKNKNQIVNLGIIILALFIAFRLYQSAQLEINALNQQKQDELKKNDMTQSIAGLEDTLEGYRKVFVKKDVSSVMDKVSGIAKNYDVKVVSIKPGREENFENYLKSSFTIVINIPSYHALGEFISQIESQKDIFLVDAVSVDASGIDQSRNIAGMNFNVNLTLSTISYL